MYKEKSGIYCIGSPINKKVYIGYSVSITHRWAGHRCKLRKGTHVNIHLQDAWNLYGEDAFVFSILELLPHDLTKSEYEIVETKWVLHYNSYLREFGYNKCLPGSIPLYRQEENTTNLKRGNFSNVAYVCMNMNTGEIIKASSTSEVCLATGIKTQAKVSDLAAHWETKCKRKSLYGWMVVKEDIYDPEFDYINFKRHRSPSPIKKTWRDYERPCIKKSPEEIIPIEDRNLKRVSVIAVNIITGEEKVYTMLKDCYKEFARMKVYKCINSPFGKYKHRGHFFKKVPA